MLNIIESLPFARLKDYLAVSFPHLTLKKFVNILKTEANFWLKKRVLTSYPYFLVVDPSNICQLACPLCATGQKKHPGAGRKMSFATFKKIIDEIGEYLLEVHLVWWGEPFLNPEILRFVKYAHRKNIATFISTNFSFPFGQKKMTEIVASGLDVLLVSLDGITPEVYGKYRVKGNFSWVINNIKLLAKTKSNLKAKRPLIEWQFLVNIYNESQIPHLKPFARTLGVNSIVLEQMITLSGQSKLEQKLINWLPRNSLYRAKKYSLLTNKSDNLKPGRCWWLWRAAAISPDGGVSPCCYNNDAHSDFGNLTKNRFKDIWNNEKYRAARSLFNKKKPKADIICNQCSIAKTRR